MPEKKDEFVFWVPHSRRYISFRPLPHFDAMCFENDSSMWQMVHAFVKRGYVVS